MLGGDVCFQFLWNAGECGEVSVIVMVTGEDEFKRWGVTYSKGGGCVRKDERRGGRGEVRVGRER